MTVIISENLNAKFSIESIEYRFFNKIQLSNAYVEDQQGDTLLFAPEISANIWRINGKDRVTEIGRLTLTNAQFNLKSDSAQVVNLKFITNQIKELTDTTKKRMKIVIHNIDYIDGVFTFSKHLKKQKLNGINFTDLRIKNLNFATKGFLTREGGVTFQVRNLSFYETSGFFMKDMDAEVKVFNDELSFSNVRLETEDTRINSELISLNFKNYSEFQNFSNRVNLDITINNSNIFLPDLAYFIPMINILDHSISFSGKIQGKIANLHGRNIDVKYGSETNLNGKFDISGLPHIDETFWYLNLDHLNIYPLDIAYLYNSIAGKNISIPENILQLDQIHFFGVFSGFYNDFVSYGKFETLLGDISTDISIVPDEEKSVRLKGKLDAQEFDIGKFVSTDGLIQKMNMNVEVNGTIFQDKSISGELKGNIASVEINKYNYQNIKLDGMFLEKSFDGSISIDDPNIKFDFLGLVDFTAEEPEFDFTLNLPYAHLYNLNINPNDTTSNLSLLMTANFTGSSPENMNGTIKLLNAKYTLHNKEIEGYDFSLIGRSHSDSSWIVLNTEYLDASLIGKYQFDKIIPSLKFIQASFLPATLGEPPDTAGIYKNNFYFEAKVKNADKLSDFFAPSIWIAPGAEITGWFQPSQKQLLLEGSANYFYARQNILEKPFFILASEELTNLSFNLTSENVIINDNLNFEDFDFHSEARNDSLVVGISWLKTDSVEYAGDMEILTKFSRSKTTNNLKALIEIPSSDIIHNNIPWNINKSSVIVDSTSFHFKDILLRSNDIFLGVNGTISESASDTLFLNAQNFILNTKGLVKDKLSIKGIVSGDAKVSGIYDTLLFLSHMNFSDLYINDEALGEGIFITEWAPGSNAIQLLASTKKGSVEQLHAIGNYVPQNKFIDLDINLEKLRVSMFQPFISVISSELGGMVTGNLTLKGKQGDLGLNGNLDFQKTSMMLDYTNTRYSFADRILVRNNEFLFSNLEAFDSLGNKAVLNGKISAYKLKELAVNLKLETTDLMVLNLTEDQNDLFYGDAFASGVISIYGPTKELTIDANARTEAGTDFKIPLDKGRVLEDLSYVTFIKKEVKEDQTRLRRPVRRIEIDEGKNLLFNINLVVTPEAQATLQFEPASGGSLAVNGAGELRMGINREKTMNLSGEYIIDEGIYNFTLSNLINKRFDVKQGSKIIWNGDPSNARLDVTAVYQVRTSLQNLFNDDQYQRRIPVDCEIKLTGNLGTPIIQFNITLPTADEDTKSKLANSITTEEELNKQFLSLLIINSFVQADNPLAAGDAFSVTTFEMLSNQLSNWISQISNDFDIGFHYRPGDEVSSEEIEVALSTQILNDRVLINSNIDVGRKEETNTNQTSNVVGDVSVEVKIDKRGKFRVKAFTRPHDNLYYGSSSTPYVSGVGIFFKEEFNSFGSLVKGYWNKIFKSKEEKAKKEQKKKAEAASIQ